MIIVGGIFGAVILSAHSDRCHKRRLFLILTMSTAIPLVILLQFLSSIVLPGITGFVFGFFLVSALPIGLTYAVEKNHPVPGPASNGVLMLSGQVSGILMTLLFNMRALSVLFGVGLTHEGNRLAKRRLGCSGSGRFTIVRPWQRHI